MQTNGINYMTDTKKSYKETPEDKVVAEVRETLNFDQFKGVIGNRGISERHVMSLIKSITKRNMLKQNPVIVTQKMEVIDGQHRIMAAKALNTPIYYMVVENAGIEEIQQLNTYNRVWTSYDYLESYSIKGMTQYIQFGEFLTEYELPVAGGFILLFNDNGGGLYDRFRNGRFDFEPEQMEKARELADLLVDIRKSMTGGNYRRVYMLKALRQVYDKGYGKTLVEKLELSQMKLSIQFSLRDYLRMFEDVLNWKNKTGEPLRLF